MNEKEIAEIRRRFQPDKNSITHVLGCYVNEKREIVSRFDQSMAMMPQEDAEIFLKVLKRALSGTLGKNLTDISFTTQQVVDSPEHRLLMALKNSKLKDEEALQSFFQLVSEALAWEGTYLILMAYDTYDVPYRSKDGFRQDDAGSEVYSYFLCAICPIKTTTPALSYDIPENQLQNRKTDWLVAPPELGFLFPAFDDRSTNIYNALYYTRSSEENHPEFTEAVFHVEASMPAEEQRETFQSMLAESLDKECSFDMMQAIHDQFSEIIEEHKASKSPEPLTLSQKAVEKVLESCGASPEKSQAFGEKFQEEFGDDAQLNPKLLIDTKHFQVCTPNVTIQVSPEFSSLVETKVIDGAKYILIRAEDGVEVNGVPVCFQEENADSPQ